MASELDIERFNAAADERFLMRVFQSWQGFGGRMVSAEWAEDGSFLARLVVKVDNVDWDVEVRVSRRVVQRGPFEAA